jgi:hypothetical protein
MLLTCRCITLVVNRDAKRRKLTVSSKQDRQTCGIANPGGKPCPMVKGHSGGHDPESYGPRTVSSENVERFLFIDSHGEEPFVRCSDYEALERRVAETLDDAVIRVGCSANCYDVPADANSGAEYVAMRVRQVINPSDCQRLSERVHWKFESTASAMACGVDTKGLAWSRIGDTEITCPDCRTAFIGYQFGRADERAKHQRIVKELEAERDYWKNFQELNQERLDDYNKIGSMPAIVKSVDYGAMTLAECVEKTVDRFYNMGLKDGQKRSTPSLSDAIKEVESLRDQARREHTMREARDEDKSILRILANQISAFDIAIERLNSIGPQGETE